MYILFWRSIDSNNLRQQFYLHFSFHFPKNIIIFEFLSALREKKAVATALNSLRVKINFSFFVCDVRVTHTQKCVKNGKILYINDRRVYIFQASTHKIACIHNAQFSLPYFSVIIVQFVWKNEKEIANNEKSAHSFIYFYYSFQG